MRKFIPTLTTIALLTLNGIVSACPMCKDSIPNNDAEQVGGVPAGFNHSVYLLLVGFLAVLGMMSFIVVKGVAGTQPRAGFPIKPLDPKNHDSDKNDSAE